MQIFKELKRKEVIAWAFYDFANSSYSFLILSFVFPIFFKEVIAGTNGEFWWGLNVSISVLLAGILSPIIGAIADYDSRKKIKFTISVILAAIGTALLFFTGSNLLLFSSILFILTTMSFEISQTLYDSFLTHISTKENVGKISGFGWGLGYLGGIVSMLLLRPFYANGFEQNLGLYKLTFPLTALFYFTFSIPIFIFLKENKTQIKHKFKNLVKIGFSRVKQTLKEVKLHKNVGLFLIAFYLMSDALVTLFSFITIYAKDTLNIPMSEITILLLMAQLIAFPSTLVFGIISDKISSKKMLLSSLFIWIIIVILLIIANSKQMFYLIVVLTALVVGSSQSIARAWLTKIIPENKKTEFFGFNGFANKISAATGPLIFGTVSVLFNQRIAMIPLGLFFVGSFLIFTKVKE